MRPILRFLSRLFGLRPREAVIRRPDHQAELAAARLFMTASARVDLPGPCLKALGEGLIELAKTLPDETADDGLWGRP